MGYRKFLNVLLLVVFLGFTVVTGAIAQQVPLNPNKIPQFVDPLPLLSVQGGGPHRNHRQTGRFEPDTYLYARIQSERAPCNHQVAQQRNLYRHLGVGVQNERHCP